MPTFVYKLNGRTVDKLATNHFARASHSCSRTVRAKLISAFSLQLEDPACPVLIGIEY